MQKHNLLFGLVGIVLGVVIGYFATQYINQNKVTPSNASAASGPQRPAGMPQEVLDMLKKANDEPNNFEAQVQASMLYRQIGRREKELEFLQRAATPSPPPTSSRGSASKPEPPLRGIPDGQFHALP